MLRLALLRQHDSEASARGRRPPRARRDAVPSILESMRARFELGDARGDWDHPVVSGVLIDWLSSVWTSRPPNVDAPLFSLWLELVRGRRRIGDVFGICATWSRLPRTPSRWRWVPICATRSPGRSSSTTALLPT
jgi:hypothetical protein